MRYLERLIDVELLTWAKAELHKPLLLRSVCILSAF